MKRLKRSFFITIRQYFTVLRITADVNELCTTRHCIEEISKLMWSQDVITYNTLKNIRVLTSVISNKRIVK